MVVIKKVMAKSISNSNKEKTILIKINTNVGKFYSSSPNGKFIGKKDVKPYKKDLEGDIKAINDLEDYFSEDIIEKFEDLRRIEDIVDGSVGVNTLFALESAILKALAKKEKKEVWQVIGPTERFPPRIIFEVASGGMHSQGEKIPDFQSFYLIPQGKSVKDSYEKIKKALKLLGKIKTSLMDKEVLDSLRMTEIPLGIDVAGSTFYKRKHYHYKNPIFKRTNDEHLFMLSNLVKNYGLDYIEDPFDKDDFESFSKLLKKFPGLLVVGDSITGMDSKKLEKAIKNKSINAVIVKPSQAGSLLKLKSFVELAKKNGVKIIFATRYGETDENILADLAFGFGANFLKTNIDESEKLSKVKRLIDIEKRL